jgi:uncharacterized membrane protein YedE/YeeE
MNITSPWPWYVAGTLIGLIVPALLILGNKHFGISSNLRHICAACIPSNIPFFKYDWKKESWNLFFIGGIFIGGFIAAQFLGSDAPILIHPDLANPLSEVVVDAIKTISGKKPDDDGREKPIDLHMIEIMHMQHKRSTEKHKGI